MALPRKPAPTPLPTTPTHGDSTWEQNPPEWFSRYLQRGFRLIPYPQKQKGPTGPDAKNWPENYITTLDGYREESNWGVLLGTEVEPGRFLLDIDFDWQEGVALARRLLPTSSFVFGRGDRAVTHVFYTASLPLNSVKYEDIDGQVLVELRGAKVDGSIGLQTMLPPSVHPSGDIVTLRADEEITFNESIGKHVANYAVACLFFRHIGNRGLLHDTRMALSGFLLGDCGAEKDDVLAIIEAIAEATGNDLSDARLTVNTTAARIAKNLRVSGKASLTAVLGDDGKRILSKAREWLGGGTWKVDKQDKTIPNNEENVKRALEKLGCKMTFDAFGERVLMEYGGQTGLMTDQRVNRLWLDVDKHFYFRPSAEFFLIILQDLAYENSFHPVVNYLNTLKWDGKPRLNKWLVDYGGAADNEYTHAVSALPLIAAVRRVRQSASGIGVKFDELLVFESQQGFMKSSALRALCPNDDWFSDDLPLNVDAKELIERTVGKWIIEAGELAGMKRGEVEQLKGMLSRQKDGPVRMAYAKTPIERCRQFIVIGTTNSETYLKDSTGNRRFWPLRVGKFNVDGLRFVRDQLWAEAAHREAAGDTIRLAPDLYPHATVQQERRRAEDPWETKLEMAFGDEGKKYRLTPDEVWGALGISIDRRDPNSHDRVLTAMKRLGFERGSVRDPETNKVVKGFRRDPKTDGTTLPWDMND